MFCPHCGSEIPNGSEFCDICGESVDETPKSRDAMLGAAPKRNKQVAEDDIAKDTPYSIAAKKQSKKYGGHRIAIGIIAVAIVAACVVAFAVSGGVEGLQKLLPNGVFSGGSPTSAAAEPSGDSNNASASSAAEDAGESAASNDGDQQGGGQQDVDQQSSASANPMQGITFDNVAMKEDSLGRYYVTGKITNSNDREYTAKFKVSANEHSTDAYKEDSVKEVLIGNLVSTTSLCYGDGSDVYAFYLQPGESRDFVLYPNNLSKAEVSYTDARAELIEAIMTGSVQQRVGYCLDSGDLFEIKNLTYGADGEIAGTLVNKSEKYFREAYPIFVMKDASGDYSVESAGGTRPAGVVIESAKVENMAPGDEKPFKVNAGKGYASAAFLEVEYKVDTSKGA